MNYIYKENQYQVQGKCEYKCQQTRQWIQAVIYKSSTNQVYVREQTEFYKLFQLCQE